LFSRSRSLGFVFEGLEFRNEQREKIRREIAKKKGVLVSGAAAQPLGLAGHRAGASIHAGEEEHEGESLLE